MSRPFRLKVEALEKRELLDASAMLSGGVLTVIGTPGDDRIDLLRDADQLVVHDRGREIGRFDNAAVASIAIATGDGRDIVRVASNVTQPAVIDGGAGDDVLRAGGGPTILVGGDGQDKLYGGPADDLLDGGDGRDLLHGRGGENALDGGPGADKILQVKPADLIAPDPADQVSLAFDPVLLAPVIAPIAAEDCIITAAQVTQLLDRASAATPSRDAIIAIVDRNGRILGVRVEDGVSPGITSNPDLLTFAIDGAVAKARTGAFFGNNQAPLTSRTIEFISQSTITQREVNSIPSITDPNSSFRGPGFVAPVQVGGHFPPEIPNTPPVDLFAIEHTNRDGPFAPGPDRIIGTADDIPLPTRFNINPAFVPPGQEIFAPVSYGVAAGLNEKAVGRGIATLPGGIPIYLPDANGNLCLVGGIGVFFPGTTGFATEENSALSTTFDPSRPDRSLEAEFIAFAAVGGAPALGFPFGALGGVPPLAGAGLPLTRENMRIDLVGITLDIVGPGGIEGPERLVRFGLALGPGTVNGTDQPVTAGGDLALDGLPVPTGWLVAPHDGVGVTAADVEAIITAGINQANRTRAAIRLPLDSRTRMVFAVTDLTGEVLGLFRMPDATVFSIDVAVAKARNVAYFADPAQLQPIDNPGVPPGTAFTNRTFRYLALPRFPSAIDGRPPGPFSILNDGGADPFTGLQIGPPLPASAFQSVLGFDSFNPGTNFRQAGNLEHQNGIVFFPGSAPIYRNAPDGNTGLLIGGFGVSGDGVDQDDVVTFAGSTAYGVPNLLLRADEVFVRGVRLPYQKFNRHPEG